MKSAPTNIIDKVKQGSAIHTSQRVIVEWNQNRYSPITSIANGSTADAEPDLFPIKSIADPIRPTRGVVKARVSTTGQAGAIGADGYVSRPYGGSVRDVKYVTASVDSKYKYWSSPTPSTGTYSSVPSAIANCAPQIIYTNPTWTNKVVVGFESSYAAPSAYTVQITTDGTNWTTIATNIAVPTDGRLVLYRQSDGTWGPTVSRDYPIQIRGIRLSVTQMDKSAVYFNLIELSPRLESDISGFVKKWSFDIKMSDHSFVAPIGRLSANTGSIELSNIDARFSNDNTSSPYAGMLDKGAYITIDLGVSLDAYESTSKTYEWIRMATMRSDDWNGQTRLGTTIDIKDDSEYLQTIKPNPTFYKQVSAAEIVWRLLDSVGYSNYNYEKIDSDAELLVPYFWTDGEDTLWDIFNDLAEATQSAIYFDEYGVLQIKTRNTAYNMAKTSVWQLDAVLNSPKLPDIKELEKTYDYEANVVNVNYRTTSISDDSGGNPAMEVVWEPDGDLVLRSSDLVKSMTNSQLHFTINSQAARTWPFDGVVNIEGEFIKYVSKDYLYYNASGVRVTKSIKSEDERKELDNLYPQLAFANAYSGKFNIATDGRGYWNSVAKAHDADASGYYARYRTYTGPIYSWTGGLLYRAQEGVLRMATNSTFGANAWYVASRSTGLGGTARWYGTRLKFPSGTGWKNGIAGMAIGSSTNDAGFYIELINTKSLDPGSLTLTNELCFMVRYSDGTYKRIGPNGGKGVRLEVVPDKWYDIDVFVTINGATSTTFNISINGVNQMTVTVPSANYPQGAHGSNSNISMFTRGFSHADFEYLGASSYRGAAIPTFDEPAVLDLINGGYRSNQRVIETGYWLNTMTRRNSTSPNTATNTVYSSLFFDEFGPVVHEVREFDVAFTKTPVVHSRLYYSNETQVVCPQYSGNAFGAKFIMANAHRENAVINGEDSLTFGIDNTVTQRAMVYARTVTQAEEEIVTVKNENGIRRRGEVSVDINSPWVQSKSAAKAIADWISLHWGGGCDEVQVECFGNPFLQLGDVVSINDPLNSMAPNTHKYFIVSIDHDYTKGLNTSLTLRRARI